MLLISTSSLKGYGLHRIMHIVKKCGYEGIDLLVDNDDFDAWNPEYLLSLIQESGTPIISITAPAKKMTISKVDKLIQIAKTVNARVITFSPPHTFEKNIRWFSEYLNLAQKNTKVILSVKNVTPKFMFFVIPEYKKSNLDILKDITGHTTFDVAAIDSNTGIDISKAHQLLGNTICNVMISDKVGEIGGFIPGKGKGNISYLPLESLLMKLKTSEYKGDITISVSPSEIGIEKEKNVESNLNFIKKYIEKYFTNFE